MNKKILTSSLSAVGMLLLILDAKTALSGAAEGLEMCIHTIIPSLLPFFLLSVLLTDSLAGIQWRFLKPIARILRIPEGSESIVLIGLLGGYPTGAQSVKQCWSAGILSTGSAKRMLGFCSNAGPAFLFGLVATQFAEPTIPWILWIIHIASALLSGLLIPGSDQVSVHLGSKPTIGISNALQKSLRIMGSVCGWVILFRVIIAFAQRWFLWYFPVSLQVGCNLLLELASGCLSLCEIPDEGIRMLLCSCSLSFGGVCVLMQTVSVTAGLGLGSYIPGKIMQTVISGSLTCLYLYTSGKRPEAIYPAFFLAILLLFVTFFMRLKIKGRNPQKAVV